MDEHRRVSGKADGKLDLLIVRPYYYRDERIQGILDKVTEIWHNLPIPPNTKLVSLRFPKFVDRYSVVGRGFPFYARTWYSYRELKIHPAKWLVVADADVLPTCHDALYRLYNFLAELPDSVSVVTRNPLIYATNPYEECLLWIYHRLRLSRNGITLAPSDGLVALRFAAAPYYFNATAGILPYGTTEFWFSQVLDFKNVASFPQSLCSIFNPRFPPPINNASPAFLHFSGDGLHSYAYARAVEECWVRILG